MLLHTFYPQPIFFQLGPFTIRYYGLLMVCAIAVCFIIALRLAKKRNIPSDDLFDLGIWLIIAGIIGARLYDVLFIDWDYFHNHLIDILKIWTGGIAIHGAIIGALIAAFVWIKLKNKTFWPEFWRLSSLLFTVLPLGQAIGRWGNYFNQELYGRPTDLPWGMPIAIENRPDQYLTSTYFHPAFLYESLLDLALFFILLLIYKKNRLQPVVIPFIYLIGYAVIRFSTEFIRIDPTPVYFGLRLPQLVSIAIFAGSALFLILRNRLAPRA